MTVGILGLGLIGGSLARTYAKAGHTVLAFDLDTNILSFAQLAGAVSDELNETNIPQCDLILLSVYANASASWLETNAKFILFLFISTHTFTFLNFKSPSHLKQ